MLDDGRYASISEVAAAEKLDRGHLGRLLQLTLLAPEPKATPGARYIVEAIVEGRQKEGVTLPGLLKSVPENWVLQRPGLIAPCCSAEGSRMHHQSAITADSTQSRK